MRHRHGPRRMCIRPYVCLQPLLGTSGRIPTIVYRISSTRAAPFQTPVSTLDARRSTRPLSRSVDISMLGLRGQLVCAVVPVPVPLRR